MKELENKIKDKRQRRGKIRNIESIQKIQYTINRSSREIGNRKVVDISQT